MAVVIRSQSVVAIRQARVDRGRGEDGQHGQAVGLVAAAGTGSRPRRAVPALAVVPPTSRRPLGPARSASRAVRVARSRGPAARTAYAAQSAQIIRRLSASWLR